MFTPKAEDDEDADDGRCFWTGTVQQSRETPYGTNLWTPTRDSMPEIHQGHKETDNFYSDWRKCWHLWWLRTQILVGWSVLKQKLQKKKRLPKSRSLHLVSFSTKFKLQKVGEELTQLTKQETSNQIKITHISSSGGGDTQNKPVRRPDVSKQTKW